MIKTLDLQTYCENNPESTLLREWDFERNKDVTPSQVTIGSHRKVWWKCAGGHSWQTAVRERVKGKRCPFCMNRRLLTGFNDLQTRFPEIAKQCHPILNGNLTAQMVTSGSKKKVWWECSEGHVWQAVVYSRTGKTLAVALCAQAK